MQTDADDIGAADAHTTTGNVGETGPFDDFGFGLADDPILWQVLDNLAIPNAGDSGGTDPPTWLGGGLTNTSEGVGVASSHSASVKAYPNHANSLPDMGSSGATSGHVHPGAHPAHYPGVVHPQGSRQDDPNPAGRFKSKGKGKEAQTEAELLQAMTLELESLGAAGKGEEGRRLRNKIAQQRHRMRKRMEVEGLHMGVLEMSSALEQERTENQRLQEVNARLEEELMELRKALGEDRGFSANPAASVRPVSEPKRPAHVSAAARADAAKEEPHDWTPSAVAKASAPIAQAMAGPGANPAFEQQFCDYQALVTKASRIMEAGDDGHAGGPLDLITREILLTSRKLCPMLGQTDPLVMSRGNIAEDFKPVFRVCARAGHLSLSPEEIQNHWHHLVKVKLGLTADQVEKLLAEREKLIASLGAVYQARKVITQSLALSLSSAPLQPPSPAENGRPGVEASAAQAFADQNLVNSLVSLKASLASEREIRVSFADRVFGLLSPRQRLTIFLGPHPSVPSILVVVNMVSTFKDEILASAAQPNI